MIALFRTALTMVTAAVMTTVLGSIVLIASALKIPHRPGSIYDRAPRIWSRAILWAGGVKITVHGRERIPDAATSASFIFTSNHVSLFDIPSLVSALPQHYFVAKTELFKIPVFGPGIRAVGTIPIERANQKSAFGSYTVAADRIRSGSSVVVFPEGTRGLSYEIRQFKKGPFVLAIQAGVPIIPCIVHGTIEVLPKKSLMLHPGRVDVHILDPIPTAGLTYDDRAALAERVNARMTEAMNSLYLRS